MSDFLLTQVINFGAPLIGLILLLGALGFPVGASVVVIAAGAFSQQGISKLAERNIDRSGWRSHWRYAELRHRIFRKRLDAKTFRKFPNVDQCQPVISKARRAGDLFHTLAHDHHRHPHKFDRGRNVDINSRTSCSSMCSARSPGFCCMAGLAIGSAVNGN